LASWGYRGASFGKKPEKSTPAQQYLREKAALDAAQKYYTTEEFEVLMSDFRNGLLTVRIYDDGVTIRTEWLRTHSYRLADGPVVYSRLTKDLNATVHYATRVDGEMLSW
jgi:hypothetical protein